jgi:glucuronoarabinoxylan endo-1,4-beta-xylanase
MKVDIMKTIIQYCSAGKIHSGFLSCLISVLFSVQVCAQAISVKGKVLSSIYPIKNASVTFIDMTDTTIRYTVVTNNSGNYQTSIITSVPPNSDKIPEKSALEQNYPNPFSLSTAITYRLNKQSHVLLTIVDVLGRQVRKYEIGSQNAGTNSVLWDGRDNSGQKVAHGIYFYVLRTESESQVGKMLFISGGEGLIPLPNTLSSRTVTQGDVYRTVLQSNTYTIRIENTENTSPLIVPLQINNVTIIKDTTINISVSYIGSAIVDLDSVHQNIRGFGGINIPGWQGYDMTDSEIQTAFGTGEGQLGFSILRLQIQPETYNWSANLPSAIKAQALGAIVFASPWDPPSNMLDPNSTQHVLRHDMYANYAAHLDSFNSYMSRNGVLLYGISVQNEPDYGTWTRWTAAEMLTFMRENAPAIHNRIIAPESFQFRHTMSDPILNDSLACAHIAIVGGHVYGAGYGIYPLAEQKGKEIWMTEHYTESANSGNLWPLALDVATDIHNVMISDWNAYVWWYIVRFYGPILDGRNNAGPRGQVTKRGYIMSQYSRFIRPGYYRIECSSSPTGSNLFVSAYKDSISSKVVIVAVNRASTPLDFVIRLKNVPMNTFTPYTTSEFKNVEQGEDITVINNQIAVTLDASSITTFVSK